MDPIAFVRLWLMVKPIAKLKARRARKRKQKLMDSWIQEHGGRPADEAAGEFFQQEDDMDLSTIKGAAKSKLVWLGLVQLAYGLFQLWATGTLSAESAGPVLSGALTIVLRAVTTQSLADKA